MEYQIISLNNYLIRLGTLRPRLSTSLKDFFFFFQAEINKNSFESLPFIKATSYGSQNLMSCFIKETALR